MKKYFKENWKNILLLYCGIYTFVTLLNSVFYLLNGIYEDPNGNWHELSRAVIVFIVVLAIQLDEHINIKNFFFKKLAIYIPTMLLVLGYVWLEGLREPLANSAYSDIFIIYTGAWICYSFIVAGIKFFKKNQFKQQIK